MLLKSIHSTSKYLDFNKSRFVNRRQKSPQSKMGLRIQPIGGFVVHFVFMKMS